MSIPCSSCYELFEREDMERCPVCFRETCEQCQCPDENGEFVICLRCADEDKAYQAQQVRL